ncbi:MAG: ATP cone domain-containing protein [Planctomycetota bacterium]|nr:ATP cone domain-containing protein [Planctomycetota bacterium]MDP6990773.1 ATP cone domain-containing protein [Planctomycetota bacterium]
MRRIKKRDGAVVDFDSAKIAAAVAAAQTAVGDEDPGFASEVAEMVEFALRRRHGLAGDAVAGEALCEVEEVQDLVEQALIELGRGPVAKAYILYRDRRSRVRSARGSGEEPSSDGNDVAGLRVQVRDAQGRFPWSKTRIVAALVNEARLSRERAEEVAGRVEARVLRSGLRRLGTGLVRELVDNELVAMGLESALARHKPVALPRHDLRELFDAPAVAPEGERPPRTQAGERLGEHSVEGAVAGGILRRFALEDLLDEVGAEAHLGGDLHVEDLERPHLHLVQTVPADLLAGRAQGPGAAFELLCELAPLTGSVSRGIVLEGAGGFLQPLVRGRRGLETDGTELSPLASWLCALRALAHARALHLDLSGLGARSPGLIARVVEALGEIERGLAPGGGPRLFLDREELAALLDHDERARATLERLLSAGLVLPTWAGPGERVCGPGCRRRHRERGALACGGAVAVNLPRLARAAGPWREDAMLAGLAAAVERAVDALARLAAFQREHRRARSGEARGRVAYALAPVGLPEALRLLGDGEPQPEQGARILGLCSEAARRFGSRHGLSVELSPCFSAEAARRFASLDAERPRLVQSTLFGEAGEGVERPGPYARGFDLAGSLDDRTDEDRAEAEAQLCSTVATGVWTRGALVQAGAGEATGKLEDWERFDALREARRSAPVGGPGLGAGSLFPLPDSPDPADRHRTQA